MTHRISIAIVIFAVFVCIECSDVGRADFNDRVEVENAGNHDIAFKSIRNAADQGDAGAWYSPGFLYGTGMRCFTGFC